MFPSVQEIMQYIREHQNDAAFNLERLLEWWVSMNFIRGMLKEHMMVHGAACEASPCDRRLRIEERKTSLEQSFSLNGPVRS